MGPGTRKSTTHDNVEILTYNSCSEPEECPLSSDPALTTGDAWSKVCSDPVPCIHCFEAAPYVVVHKYALSTEENLREVASANAVGLCNAVDKRTEHGAEKTATALIDKVANFINTTGRIKWSVETHA